MPLSSSWNETTNGRQARFVIFRLQTVCRRWEGERCGADRLSSYRRGDRLIWTVIKGHGAVKKPTLCALDLTRTKLGNPGNQTLLEYPAVIIQKGVCSSRQRNPTIGGKICLPQMVADSIYTCIWVYTFKTNVRENTRYSVRNYKAYYLLVSQTFSFDVKIILDCLKRYWDICFCLKKLINMYYALYMHMAIDCAPSCYFSFLF